MRRMSIAAGLLAFVLLFGIAAPSFAQETAPRNPMMFDDQGFHPNMLRPGTAEYDQALLRQRLAAAPRPAASEARVQQEMERCSLIAPLSQATREKCEIRAYQAALP